jgi:hypothetical protein
MKKVLIFVALFTIFAKTGICASNPFDEFKNKITGVTAEVAKKNLDNLAKDLGPLLGGGSFHRGKVLGIPGFDVGLHVPYRPISDDNVIVKGAGLDNVLLPVVQAEIGLPAKFDLLVRYAGYQDSSVVGAGLRYGIIKDSLPGIPALSVQSVYNGLTVDTGVNKLKATTITTAVVTSINFAVVEPYLGLSYDMTSVEPDSTFGVGEKGAYSGARVDAGINLQLLPLTYIQIGASSAAGLVGYTFGLGIKF